MSAFKKNPVFKRLGQKHSANSLLILVVFIILLFGLINLSSASSVTAYSKFKDAYYYFKHQLFALMVGLLAFWYFSRYDYHKLKKFAFWLLVASIFLLLMVFIPGITAEWGKARSWINIFGYSLQPSELVKLSFLLYLSAWLETRKEKLHDVSQGIGPFVIIMAVIGGLLILQPDIGTLSIITFTSLIVYYIGGGEIKHILSIIILGGFLLLLLIFWNPYQMDRFKCMTDPTFDRQGKCYQSNQSLIAVGSGGIFGRGLGSSRQKFLYIPEIQGDSIFAIIAEENGFIICSFLILAYFYLGYLGYRIAKAAPDDFGRILSMGIVSWIVIQALINIGGIINLIPMTGVPLPLISYGGTSILSSLTALGILVNISKQTKTQ